MNKIDIVNYNVNPQPTPSVFNEGYSQYETLSKLIYQINQYIESMNLGADEIAKLKNQAKYLEETGNFTGTWNGIEMHFSDEGLATDWNGAKGTFPTVSDRLNKNDERVNDVYVNVKNFGAKGDGVTDDTIAIRNAVEYCYNQQSVGNAWDMTQAYTVQKLYFPKGKYKVTSTIELYDYVHIVGSGRNGTIFIAYGCDLFNITGKYNMAFEDFTIMESSNAKLHSGFKVTLGARMIFKNITASYFNVAFDFYQGYLAEFYSCFTNYNNTGVNLLAPDNGNGCHAVRFYGGEIASGINGINVKYGNSITLFGVTLEAFTGNAINFLPDNICANFSIDSCYFENNKGEVVCDTGSLNFVKMRNCFISGTGNVDKKFIYSKGLFGVEIDNCQFGELAVGSNYKHIDAPSDVTTVTDYLRDTTITNNRVSNGSTVTINTDYTSYVSATGIDSNYIQNGGNTYSNKLEYGQRQFATNPFLSHSDGVSMGNKTRLIMNIDGSISSEYWRSYSYQGVKSGFALIGKVPTSWTAPTLLNSWVDYGAPFDNLRYSKDEMGYVHLKGAIKSGTTTASTVLFQLPSGFRPANALNFTVPSNSVFGYVRILSDGNVLFMVGSNAWIDLSGISFKAE